MKPIIFSTPMVQAILDGRKTQTRRVIKPQPKYIQQLVDGRFETSYDGGFDCDVRYIKPRYQPGDILWVRETWNYSPNWYYCYKADTIPDDNHGYIGSIPWRPSIHMPREAARIFLQVTNVKVERLQDITEEDARSEGVKDPYEYQSPEYYEQPNLRGFEINKSAFAGCWDSIYSKRGYGWYTNPWVWVYEFEKINFVI